MKVNNNHKELIEAGYDVRHTMGMLVFSKHLPCGCTVEIQWIMGEMYSVSIRNIPDHNAGGWFKGEELEKEVEFLHKASCNRSSK